MSFIQYSESQFILEINSSFNSQIAHIVPLSADTIFVLKSNRTFELVAIRKNIVIHKGKLPNDFTPCAYIEPSLPQSFPILYLFDQKKKLCRFNSINFQVELKKQIWAESLGEPESNVVTYHIIDNAGKYILISAFNTENFNTSIVIFDWQLNKYSNPLTFHRNYHNYKILNPLKPGVGLSDNISFALATTSQNFKTLCCAKIELITQPFELKLVSKKEIGLKTSLVIMGGAITMDYTYLIGNSNYIGIQLVRFYEDSQDYQSFKVELEGQEKQSGLLNKFLGIQQGNFIVSFQEIPNTIRFKKRKLIYGVPINEKSFKIDSSSKLEGWLITKKNKLQEQEEQNDDKTFGSSKMSLDGSSFHRFWIPCEDIIKKCRKEGANVETYLCTQILLCIPKKYFYAQLCQHLQLSQIMTAQIINLL